MGREAAGVHVHVPLRRPVPNHAGEATTPALAAAVRTALSAESFLTTSGILTIALEAAGQKPLSGFGSDTLRNISRRACRARADPPLLFLPKQEELRAGEEIARCPSCSLYITVIYNPVSRSAAPPPCHRAANEATRRRVLQLSFSSSDVGRCFCSTAGGLRRGQGAADSRNQGRSRDRRRSSRGHCPVVTVFFCFCFLFSSVCSAPEGHQEFC